MSGPRLAKRTILPEVSENWHLSHISFPPFFNIDQRQDLHVTGKDEDLHDPDNNKWLYSYDDESLGEGQTFYMIEPSWMPDAEVS
jgi:hypothetical protein